MTTLDRTPHNGPPLGLLAVVSAALFIASIIVGALVTGHTPPSPYGGGASIVHDVAAHRSVLSVTGMLAFGSAVPLAIYAATASTRLRALGVHVPGPTIALTGGVVAAVFQALSGLCAWVLSRPEIGGDHALVRAVHDLGFITGGPGEVVFLGLLLAGIAVPAWLRALTPRPLALSGLALAVVAELATLTIAIHALDPLLAVARFGGLAWLIAMGFVLPQRASALRRRPPASAVATSVVAAA